MNVNGQKRTIIINTFNSELLCRLPPNSISLVAKETADAKMERTSRKGRKRSLDHLTFEEKLLRKKLKNREAAQTSRDRKKARMDELEKVVKQLQKSNKELMTQMQLLKSEKEDLRHENEKLREELRCMQVRSTLESPNGSAESLVCPLPQDDYLSWLAAENCDLPNLEDFVSDLYTKSDNTEGCRLFFEEMVGSSSTRLESDRPLEVTRGEDTKVSYDNSNCIIQDAWNKAVTSETEVPSKHSNSPALLTPTECEPTVTTVEYMNMDDIKIEFNEMISEEIVVTTDPFLSDVNDDKCSSGSSICSEKDCDERISDQGYESVDSPESFSSHNDSFLELFPTLL